MPSARPSASVVRVSWLEWQASVQALLDLGRHAEAVLTLERALNDGQSPAALLELLRGLPTSARTALSGVRLHLRLLSNTGQPDELWNEAKAAQARGMDAPVVHAYLAWVLNQREQYGPALSAASRALDRAAHLNAREQALAWRMQGLALNRLDPSSDWHTPFQQALELTEGWSRAMILIDLGGLHSRQGQEELAMLTYAQALPLLRGSAHLAYRAWTLNNMGLICLRAGRLEEAETYFGQVAGLRSGFRSRALSGQAAVRRALGEWARASALYLQASAAAEAAGDQDDLRHARRGLGHTQRLAQQSMQALETLQQAAHTTDTDLDSGLSWVNVDLAAVLVGRDLLDPVGVRDYLNRTGPLDREEADRARIVEAELARREGRTDEARTVLGDLNRAALWVREEAHAFPGLFALLPPELRPEPLPRPAQLQIHLRLLGVPEVRVGGRRVALGKLEVTLLAALVLDGGDLTTEALTDVIGDGTPRSARLATQRVSRVARTLRAALGWPGSVRQGGGAYWLDPAAYWSTDVEASPGLTEHFMRGIHLPWVIEKEQELRQRD